MNGNGKMNVNAKGYEEMDEIYRRKLNTEQCCNYMHKWNDSFNVYDKHMKCNL